MVQPALRFLKCLRLLVGERWGLSYGGPCFFFSRAGGFSAVWLLRLLRGVYVALVVLWSFLVGSKVGVAIVNPQVKL